MSMPNPLIHWRIHDRVVGEARIDELVQALQNLGDSVQRVRGGAGLLEAPKNHQASRTMTITTLLDAKALVRQLGRQDELFFDLQAYDVSHWAPRLPSSEPYVNKGAVFASLNRLADLPESLWLDQTHVFIRPDSGLKTFPGDTHERALGWPAIQQKLLSRYPNANPMQLCQVGPAVELDPIEWRCWIAEGRCFAHSPYSWQDEIPWAEIPGEALELANRVAARMVPPAPIYVLDLVSVRGAFALCEINAFSTSGLYEVPFAAWLPAVRRILLAQHSSVDDHG